MKYFIIAGEASGDLHASRLIENIKILDNNASFLCLGGDLMQNAGAEIVRHYRDMAFMGFFNVLLNINKIKKNIEICKESIMKFQPDMIILVDYPGFNLRIAKWAKENLPHTTLNYYIAPKLWAWKSYRIKSIKKYIDNMYTIFPFETKYYAEKDYSVTYVGNPCIDTIEEFKKYHLICESEFKSKYNLDERPIIALLAGSRKQEIKGCLKKMIQISRYFPKYQFVVSGAPNIDINFYNNIIGHQIKIISNDTYNLLANSYAAIVNSGTATLETALIGTPQLVVYHVHGGRLASLLKKIFIKIPYISLVNIIAEKEIVKELVAHDFNVRRLRCELNAILGNTTIRNHMIGEYQIIKSNLGNVSCAKKCAESIVKDISIKINN